MKIAKMLVMIIWAWIGSASAAEGIAPDFSLRDLDGKLVKYADFKTKKPVLIDFWATWCKPCVKSLPHLQDIYERYGEKGLVVLAINEDGPRSLSKVEPFAVSLGLTMPVLIDENQDVLRGFRSSGLPTTVLIDKMGSIVLQIAGYRPGDEKVLEQKVAELLEAK